MKYRRRRPSKRLVGPNPLAGRDLVKEAEERTRKRALAAIASLTNTYVPDPPRELGRLVGSGGAGYTARATANALSAVRRSRDLVEGLRGRAATAPLVTHAVYAAAFCRNAAEKAYGGLEKRYGSATALGALAAGQALGWNVSVEGLPMGSVWRSIPAAAVAEVYLQMKQHTVELTHNTSAVRLAQELKETLEEKYEAWLTERAPKVASDYRGGPADPLLEFSDGVQNFGRAAGPLDSAEVQSVYGALEGSGALVEVPLKSGRKSWGRVKAAVLMQPAGSRGHTEEVKLSDLRRSQLTVERDRLLKVAEKHSGKQITVVRFPDKSMYVEDGHARATSHVFAGRDSILATVVEEPKVQSRGYGALSERAGCLLEESGCSVEETESGLKVYNAFCPTGKGGGINPHCGGHPLLVHIAGQGVKLGNFAASKLAEANPHADTIGHVNIPHGLNDKVKNAIRAAVHPGATVQDHLTAAQFAKLEGQKPGFQRWEPMVHPVILQLKQAGVVLSKDSKDALVHANPHRDVRGYIHIPTELSAAEAAAVTTLVGMAGTRVMTGRTASDSHALELGKRSFSPVQFVSQTAAAPVRAPVVPVAPVAPVHPSTVPYQAETVWETGKPAPGTHGGVAFAPAPHHFWEKVTDVHLKEPPLPGSHTRASILIQEADGRVWVVQPTNGFGLRQHTLPGGTVEPGLTTQQNALKETWEETGLQCEITGYVGDFDDANYGSAGKSTRTGRLYIGRRIGGAPWDAKVESHIISRKTGLPSAESETVKLVTPERASHLLERSDDKAQVMAVHPIPLGTPVRGTGSEPLKKLVAALNPKAQQYLARKAMQGIHYGTGNGELHAVQEMRGFNKPPAVVDKASFDALMAQGNHIEVLRGVGGAGSKSAKEIAEQFRTGEHFPGHGIFGSGTYTDGTRGSNNIATSYAAGHRGAGGGGADNLLRIAIPKSAKIIKESELERLVPKHPDLFKGYFGKGGKEAHECWRGVQAALAGYDAIEMDGKSVRYGTYGKGFYAILNRSIVTVQATSPSPGYQIP